MYSLRTTPFQLHFQSRVPRGAGLAHFFGGRWNREECGRDGGASELAFLRQGTAEILQVDPDAVCMGEQVHREDILVIDGDQPPPRPDGPMPSCDGFITDRPGLVLAVRTADCVPLMLFDPLRRVVGMIHAGWKGTALSIAAKAIDIFGTRFASNPSDIVAVVGPAAGACCYEVGPEVYDAMRHQSWSGSAFSGPSKDGKRILDLGIALTRQLLHRGLVDENIAIIPLCTVCRGDLFYSFRGQGEAAGRQVSAVMLYPEDGAVHRRSR